MPCRISSPAPELHYLSLPRWTSAHRDALHAANSLRRELFRLRPDRRLRAASETLAAKPPATPTGRGPRTSSSSVVSGAPPRVQGVESISPASGCGTPPSYALFYAVLPDTGSDSGVAPVAPLCCRRCYFPRPKLHLLTPSPLHEPTPPSLVACRPACRRLDASGCDTRRGALPLRGASSSRRVWPPRTPAVGLLLPLSSQASAALASHAASPTALVDRTSPSSKAPHPASSLPSSSAPPPSLGIIGGGGVHTTPDGQGTRGWTPSYYVDPFIGIKASRGGARGGSGSGAKEAGPRGTGEGVE
ncbi:hypothetical protein J5N97_004475 [Dioscorea zingiberensis]|uniref:Uncharacterized protein n=1 Tax=Dioscorea zingiberensis TaxID=325984 RepID=A0A9D5HRJ0_9LILI|nr:hypothetical protein J5N97_004475 [Dioscorea zingiberensis]